MERKENERRNKNNSVRKKKLRIKNRQASCGRTKEKKPGNRVRGGQDEIG